MAEVARSGEYGSRQNFGQVERARLERTEERPVVRTAGAIRNANISYETKRADGRATPARQRATEPRTDYPDTATSFNQAYARAGIQPSNVQSQPGSARNATANPNIRGAKVRHLRPRADNQPTRVPLVRKKKKVNAATRELARVRATTINAWVVASSAALFIPMLMLSIVSAIFLGLAFYVESLFSEAPPANAETGLIETVINGVTEVFRTIAQYVATKLFEAYGIDIIEFPMQMFSVTYAAGFGIGLMLLMLMFLIYSMSMIKSLSGSHAGTKQIAFLIALIGHSIPFMNMFPWFMIWATAVWIYPK